MVVASVASGSQDRGSGRQPLETKALVKLARRSGAAALAHFRRPGAGRAGEASPAGAVQRELELLVRDEAARQAPGLTVLSEGFPASGEQRSGWGLVVGQVGAGAEFRAGLPTWCVSLALLHNGVPLVGVVCLPALDDLYVAAQGKLTWNGVEVPRGGVGPQPGGFILGYAEFHRRRLIGFRGRGRAHGAIAYYLCLVARGAAEAAILGRARIWDVAAGMALLDAAGGEIVYLPGGQRVDPAALLHGGPAKETMLATRLGSTAHVLKQIQRR
jgi:myo-inositol-1(or 4)-monophosphatase